MNDKAQMGVSTLIKISACKDENQTNTDSIKYPEAHMGGIVSRVTLPLRPS